MSYKERLLAAVRESNKVKEVSVPDLTEPVYIRRMSGAERDSYEAALGEYRDKQGKVDVLGHGNKITARLLLVGLGDENGERVFDDDDADMVRKTFSWAAMDYLSGEVLRFNRLNDNAAKVAAKN